MNSGAGYWDSVLAPHLPQDLRQRLAAARVGIAGAGGLGSNCALLLVRSGIRHLVIADHDVVSLSNLNRQQFLPRQVGSPKVEALAEVLRGVNPDLQSGLELHPVRLDAASCRRIFAACPLVVEAVDDAATKRMLVESLLAAGHTVIAASGMGGWGGPPMTERRLGGRLIVVGDHIRGVGPDCPPMAPRVTMAAAMQADAVLSLILNGSSRSEFISTG